MRPRAWAGRQQGTGGATGRRPASEVEAEASRQELTIAHFSAQLERFQWDGGCSEGMVRGCLEGVRGV